MTRLFIAFVFVASCASSSTPRARAVQWGTPWTDQSCRDLMDSRDAAGVAGKLLVGLGGIGGLATAYPGSETTRWSIGASASALAAAGLASIWYAEAKSGEFETYCDLSPVEAAPPTITIPPVEVVRPGGTVIDVPFETLDNAGTDGGVR